MSIAIVDDDPIVCQSLATILTTTGAAEVLWTAHDGGTAVGRYFETPSSRPDVLLIDIQMPGKDGLTAAKEILRKDPAARILFLTTFADRSYIAQAMALGAKGYLIKQDVAAVGPAIQAVMAGQVVMGAEVLGKLTGSAEVGGEPGGRPSTGFRPGASGLSDVSGHLDNRDDHGVSGNRTVHGSTIHGSTIHDLTADDAQSVEETLNERERDIAALVAEGLDNRDIAHRLYLSEGTVRNRISAMLDKLGLTNRTQLAILWINTHR